MTLFVEHLLGHIRDTLGGGGLPADLNANAILNQAGEHLHSMHPWKWAQGRSTLLNLRGTASGTDATWDGTDTLTKTGAFADYTFVEGDEVEITDGTGVTTGFYEVASRVSDDAITLAADIGAAASDVDFTLQPYSVDLPDDCREVIAIHGTGTQRYHVTMTSLADVLRIREETTTNDAHWYAAISYAGSPPTPILEIAPGAGNNLTGALRLFYRARWARVSTDTTSIDVPAFIEPLLIQLVRAFARGYVREDGATLDERLDLIHRGPLFMAAKKSDGAIQPYNGTLRNGIGMWRGSRDASGWHETVYRINTPI